MTSEFHGIPAGSPLLRTLLVLVPGLALAVYVTTELASDTLLVPILSLAIILVGGLLAIATRFARFEAVMIGFLLVGYLVASRGFAQLSVVQPVFVGEMIMTILMISLLIRFVLTREPIETKSVLSRLILAFLALGAIRFVWDFRAYGINAVRDSALVYYCVFFFPAFQVAQDPRSRRFLNYTLATACVGLAVVAVLFEFVPDQMMALTVRGYPIFVQKGDITAAFTVVMLIFLHNRPSVWGSRWLRRLLVMVLWSVFVVSIARAAYAGLFIASGFLLVARQWRFFWTPALLACVGMLAFFMIDAFVDDSRAQVFVAETKDKVRSMTDYFGSAQYETTLGNVKAGNNEFRRTFWEVVVRDTTQDNPVFGKGFGHDFLGAFETEYQRGRWEGTRSPHNYYVTVYGRLGLVGLAIFGMITLVVLKRTAAAARAMRRGEGSPEALSYWCGALVILVASAFGVVLEGPVGAIPFWTLLGLATAVERTAEEERDAAQEVESVDSATAHDRELLPQGVSL